MKSLALNSLNQRVTIEQPQITSDEQGGQVIAWNELATVYADVQRISNYTTERNLADQTSASAGYKVIIRARTDVDASMRIIWKTHTLVISAIHEVDTMLEILTREEAV